MKTSELFEKELNWIFDDSIRDITKMTLDAAPKCFAVIPASSSGKYHSKADLVKGSVDEDGMIHAGGLVNHTKTVTAIAHSLMDSNAFVDIICNLPKSKNDTLQYLAASIIEQDSAIAACILHDCCKAKDDDPKHQTQFNHPILAADLFKKQVAKYIKSHKLDEIEMINLKAATKNIHSAISCHMNRWNTSKYMPDVVLPIPKTGLDVYVSLCDYLGSRKFLDFNFEVYNNEIK